MRQKSYILLMRFLNSKFFNKLLIKFTNSKLSKIFIPFFIKKYNIDISEISKSVKDFESINEFFTRQVRADLRPIYSETNVLTSPCDGLLSHVGTVRDNCFIIKSTPYRISELLDSQDVSEVEGGLYGLIYLSPSNYHRFHSLTECQVIKTYKRGDKSEPVNDMGLQYGDKPIVKNYRIVQKLRDERNNVFYIIYIGAVNVNSIVLNEKKSYKKGEEVGYFQFGSSILLLFPKDMARFVRDENSKLLFGQKLLEYI